MEFLRSVFEEQLELSPDGDGNVIIGDTTFSPVDILRADKIAFEEEYSNWLNDQWLPQQSQILEQILCVQSNRLRFREVCARLENERLIPLIGSGMSTSTGLPVWPDFLKKIRQSSTMTIDELDDLLSNHAYEEAAEQLAAAMPDRLFDESIEFGLQINSPDDICGPILFLPELFTKLVLTTNLDHVLESTYRTPEQKFGHVLLGNRIGEYRRVIVTSDPVLLKFHGDCMTREGRVLGKSEYEKVYADDSPVREELKLIYRTNSILCLGCSLNQDRTVAILAEVAGKDEYMPKHYAFLRLLDDAEAVLAREHFLVGRGIYPIWYPGDHDESIQALFVGMLRHLGRL